MNHNLLDLLNRLRAAGPRELMAYLEQLQTQFDEHEPTLQAFVPETDRFDRLRREAKTLLKRHPDPQKRPKLFGVPIGIKDIFQVEGFETQAGSQLPTHLLQNPEAPLATLFKRAGALILGKTVTTEFAYFAPGPTTNPYNPNHTPGGSSSGSAAAVGAGLCALALGTQTIGSINRPATFCGVVGYKPSYDRLDKANVIPLSPSLDHLGFLTPSVAGLEEIGELSIKRWQSVSSNGPRPILGVPEGPYLERAEPEGLAHFRQVCEQLQRAGYEVKPIKAMPHFQAICEQHDLLMSAEAAIAHQEWYDEYAHLYSPQMAALIERGRPISPTEHRRANRAREHFRLELYILMERHGLDMWIAPAATGPAPLGLESTGDPIMSLPWTQAGLPTINLPSGWGTNGLPLGTQFIGRFYGDEQLLAWAMALEKLFAFGPM